MLESPIPGRTIALFSDPTRSWGQNHGNRVFLFPVPQLFCQSQGHRRFVDESNMTIDLILGTAAISTMARRHWFAR
jgi:CRISPR/Cas system endoribonuclease Cas6 (RAMP superfamily)